MWFKRRKSEFEHRCPILSVEGTPTMRQGSVGFNISLDKLILKEEAIEEEEEREGQKHMVRTHGRQSSSHFSPKKVNLHQDQG